MKQNNLNLLIIGVLAFLWFRNRGIVSGDTSSGYGSGAGSL
jgi:hypothetical protein